jgi:hypothetical protein
VHEEAREESGAGRQLCPGTSERERYDQLSHPGPLPRPRPVSGCFGDYGAKRLRRRGAATVADRRRRMPDREFPRGIAAAAKPRDSRPGVEGSNRSALTIHPSRPDGEAIDGSTRGPRGRRSRRFGSRCAIRGSSARASSRRRDTWGWGVPLS